MRYGYCTGFATEIKDGIDGRLVEEIKEAGFDFAEFPLALTASLSDSAFEALLRLLKKLGLSADCSCNMFPGSLRLTGPKADFGAAKDYLQRAMERLFRLGTKTLVFGSTGARNLPAGTGREEGYAQITILVREIVLPLLEKYDISLAMEPIGGYEANFIQTLGEGMEIVRRVDHPRVRLLADTVHLLYEQEDPEELIHYGRYLRHFHVCENGRELPVAGYTPALHAYLEALKQIGYDKTMSFEPLPYALPGMKRALETLKREMA